MGGTFEGGFWLFWGIWGHMNLTEFHTGYTYNILNKLKKTHALGRSSVFFKN
jgi:hypothetical protein